MKIHLRDKDGQLVKDLDLELEAIPFLMGWNARIFRLNKVKAESEYIVLYSEERVYFVSVVT